MNEDYKILSIIPANGWVARFHNPDNHEQPIEINVMCWATIRWPNGFESVEGIVNSPEGFSVPAYGSKDSLDLESLGYFKAKRKKKK